LAKVRIDVPLNSDTWPGHARFRWRDLASSASLPWAQNMKSLVQFCFVVPEL